LKLNKFLTRKIEQRQEQKYREDCYEEAREEWKLMSEVIWGSQSHREEVVVVKFATRK
jgi:hypothetical protein